MSSESPYEPTPQSPHYVPHHPVPSQVAPLVNNQPAPATQNDYAFIFDPPKPAQRSLFPNGGSLLQRVLLAAGALLIIIVAITLIKGLFAGSSNIPELTSVVQDQHQLIHLATLTTNPRQQQLNTSTTTKNTAVTIQLGLTSAQNELLKYLKTNGHTINTKVLSQKVSAATDAQLTAAASAGTYDATFKEIVSSQLASYEAHLKLAYAKTKGLHGQALLSKDYNSAKLLATQLNSPVE